MIVSKLEYYNYTLNNLTAVKKNVKKLNISIRYRYSGF